MQERAEETPLSPEAEAARLARARAKVEHEAERLRRKSRRESTGRVRIAALDVAVGVLIAWGIITALTVVAVAVVVFFVLGGLGGGGGPDPTPKPDPRIDGPATATVTMQAVGEEDGSTFVPNTLTISAGEVTEIVVTNVAVRVSHNLRVSGEDGEYETDDPKNLKDDWLIPIIEVGKTGRLLIIMETPGSYKFQCDFHPVTQKGTLIVQ
jgi:plastocyanin